MMQTEEKHDVILTAQIRAFNTELTVGSFCFVFVTFFFCYLFPLFLNVLFLNPNFHQYWQMPLLLNQPYIEFTSSCLSVVGYLLVGFAIWGVINFVQMCCLAIDQFKSGSWY